MSINQKVNARKKLNLNATPYKHKATETHLFSMQNNSLPKKLDYSKIVEKAIPYYPSENIVSQKNLSGKKSYDNTANGDE